MSGTAFRANERCDSAINRLASYTSRSRWIVLMVEDPFAELRNSSPRHAAIISPDGALILMPRISGDEQSLIDFQAVALKALEIATKNTRHVTEHLVPGRRGGRLYDRIVIHP